jgi:hypothetical protein
MRLHRPLAALLAAILLATRLMPCPARAGDPPAGTDTPAAKPAALPRLSRVAIADTGAAAYLPGVPEWSSSIGEDGARTVSGTVVHGEVGAGVLAVRFKTPIGDAEASQLEALLIRYLEHLAANVFELTDQMPPGRGQRLATHPSAQGVLLIGRDRDGTEFWIKGWIDAGGIGISYVFADTLPPISWTEAVLGGFRFPGD